LLHSSDIFLVKNIENIELLIDLLSYRTKCQKSGPVSCNEMPYILIIIPYLLKAILLDFAAYYNYVIIKY
jgi:hypothetical protein